MRQTSPLTSLALLTLSATPLTQVHALPLIDGLRNLVLRGPTGSSSAQDALPLQAASPQRPISPPQPGHLGVYPDAAATPAAHIVKPRADVAAATSTSVAPVVPSSSDLSLQQVMEYLTADQGYGDDDYYDYGYMNSSGVPGVAAAYSTGVPGVAAAFPTGLSGSGLSGNYDYGTPSDDDDDDPLISYKGPGAISPGPSYDPMQGYALSDEGSESDNGDEGDIYRTSASAWSNQDEIGDSNANLADYGQDDDQSQGDDDENYDSPTGSSDANDMGDDSYSGGDPGDSGAAASAGPGDDFYGILANLGLAGAGSTSIPASLTAAVKSIQNLEQEAAELSGQSANQKRDLPADNPAARATNVPLVYQGAPYLQNEFNEGMAMRSRDDRLSAGKRQRRDLGDILSDDIEKLNARISSLEALPESARASLQQAFATDAMGAETTTAPNLNEKRDWADWASSQSKFRGERYSRFLARVSSIEDLPPAARSSYEAAHPHTRRAEWRAKLSSIRNLPPAAQSSWVAEHPHLQIHRGGLKGVPTATDVPLPRVKRDVGLKNLAERQMMMPGDETSPISGLGLHQYRESPGNVSRELPFEPQPLDGPQDSNSPISPDNTMSGSDAPSNFSSDALFSPAGPVTDETPSADNNNWTNPASSVGSQAWEMMEIQALEEILRNLTLNSPLMDINLPADSGAGAYKDSDMSGQSTDSPDDDLQDGDPTDEEPGLDDSRNFGLRGPFNGNMPTNDSGLVSSLDFSNPGSGLGGNLTATSSPSAGAMDSATDQEPASDETDSSTSADQPQSVDDPTAQGSPTVDSLSGNTIGTGQGNDVGTIRKRQGSAPGNSPQLSGMGEDVASPPLSSISLDSPDPGNATESMGTQMPPPSLESFGDHEDPYRDALHNANFSTYSADQSDPPFNTPANTLATSDSNNPGPQNQPWDQASQSISGFPFSNPPSVSGDDPNIPAHFPTEGEAGGSVADAPFPLFNSSNSHFGGVAYPAPTGTGFSMALLSASNVVVEMVETNVPIPGVGVEEILELDVIKPGDASGDSFTPPPDAVLGSGSGADSIDAQSGSPGSAGGSDLGDLGQFDTLKLGDAGSPAAPPDQSQPGAAPLIDPLESNSTLGSGPAASRNTSSPDLYSAFLNTPDSGEMGDTSGVHDSAASLTDDPPAVTSDTPPGSSLLPGGPQFKPRFNKIRRQVIPEAVPSSTTSSTLATSTTSAPGAAISSVSPSSEGFDSLPLRGSYVVGPNTPAQPAANLPNLNATSHFPPIYERPSIANSGNSFSPLMPGLLRRPGARHGRHWFPGQRGQRYTRNETERTRELLRGLRHAREGHMSLHETNITLPGNKTEELFELDLMIPNDSPLGSSLDSSAFPPGLDPAPATFPSPASLENSTFAPLAPAPIIPPRPSLLENGTFDSIDNAPLQPPRAANGLPLPISPLQAGAAYNAQPSTTSLLEPPLSSGATDPNAAVMTGIPQNSNPGGPILPDTAQDDTQPDGQPPAPESSPLVGPGSSDSSALGNTAMDKRGLLGKRGLFENIGEALGIKGDAQKEEEGKDVKKRADAGDAVPKVEDMNIKWKNVGKGVVGVIKDGQALPLDAQ